MADIQLSSQLLQDIQDAVTKQHPDADQATVMQYLAAVTGYLLATQSEMSEQGRSKFLDDLCSFARHVVEDVSRSQAQKQAAAAPAPGVGYWEPPQS